MGIKELWKPLDSLRQDFPSLAEAVEAGILKAGQKIAIDVSVLLHVANAHNAPAVANGYDPDVTFALRSLVQQILNLGMVPVLVLDGMSFPLKDSTVGHRSSIRERALAHYRQAAKDKDHTSCSRLAKTILSKIDPGHIYDVISYYESLRVSGARIELVFAPFEAGCGYQKWLSTRGFP
mmetsp:Transcript_6006/g.18368  ORF Transcript_6006/g.18368 Transcript_6006/m.18368 type:complete len:179 (-) Transcript_6006:86-622(-)